jgi:hypothetical protein
VYPPFCHGLGQKVRALKVYTHQFFKGFFFRAQNIRARARSHARVVYKRVKAAKGGKNIIHKFFALRPPAYIGLKNLKPLAGFYSGRAAEFLALFGRIFVSRVIDSDGKPGFRQFKRAAAAQTPAGARHKNNRNRAHYRNLLRNP